MKLQAVLMAAGASTRFAGIKQLAMINGEALVNICIRHVLDGGVKDLTLVLGSAHEKIRQIVEADIKVHVASEWASGLGHSMASAVKNLDGDTTHLLIVLADQLAISAEQIRLLVNQASMTPDCIICCRYKGAIGVPAIFPSAYFSQLLSLTGDKGAKGILSKNRQALNVIDMQSAAFDIDTKQDLATWKDKHI